MKITKIHIHNFRSIIDAQIEAHDFLVLVGPNNAGKSNIINALRCFYDDLKWTEDDFPKKGANDQVSWVELTFKLSDNEWESLADKYKKGVSNQSLVLRRYFKGSKAKARQSNIYGIVNGVEEDGLFYGAKQVSTAKCGGVVYIPALTTPSEQMKTTGPSTLRNMLNFILKKVVTKSPSYNQLGKAFEEFNKEAKNDNGFLAEISQPINKALRQWNVKIDLSITPISPEEISKYLFKCVFVDNHLDGVAFDLDRFGHGFQRSVIYELIRIAPDFQEDKEIKKKEFSPDFTLLLFEEPEAFLHPCQQEKMAYHLRKLASKPKQQVFITSHSPVFVSKSSDNLCQICRIQKKDGISEVYQVKESEKENLIKAGGDFLEAIQQYVDDPSYVDEGCKNRARRLIENAPQDEIASQHERFRFQLWLDSERASMFFSDKVLLVEGATEKALFNYLLANDWYDLTNERILVVDALGKFNFHRFLALFKAFGIYHGIMFDNDDEKNEHAVINQLIRDRRNQFTLAEPFEFDKCLEIHLDLNLPGRADQKPLEILKALEDKRISAEQITELRNAFCRVLAINGCSQ